MKQIRQRSRESTEASKKQPCISLCPIILRQKKPRLPILSQLLVSTTLSLLPLKGFFSSLFTRLLFPLFLLCQFANALAMSANYPVANLSPPSLCATGATPLSIGAGRVNGDR